jgi:ADP-heptose:LPS heptosyltransferase
VTFPLGIGDAEIAWAGKVVKSATGKAFTVGLSPSARWTTKRWPIEHFAALGDELTSSGAAAVVIGGPAGEAAAVARLMRERAIIADNITDPLKMAALMKRLDVMVTNDSGPMHLAAAVAVPVVALFGPTNHRRTGPYGGRHTVICAPVDCRPCYERECPQGQDCMRSIAVETVRHAIEETIKTAGEHR